MQTLIEEILSKTFVYFFKPHRAMKCRGQYYIFCTKMTEQNAMIYCPYVHSAKVIGSGTG